MQISMGATLAICIGVGRPKAPMSMRTAATTTAQKNACDKCAAIDRMSAMNVQKQAQTFWYKFDWAAEQRRCQRDNLQRNEDPLQRGQVTSQDGLG